MKSAYGKEVYEKKSKPQQYLNLCVAVDQSLNTLEEYFECLSFSDLCLTVKRLQSNALEALPRLLMELTQSPDWNTRMRAAIALSQIGVSAKQAIPALTIAAKESNFFVSRYAKYALDKIRDTSNLKQEGLFFLQE